MSQGGQGVPLLGALGNSPSPYLFQLREPHSLSHDPSLHIQSQQGSLFLHPVTAFAAIASLNPSLMSYQMDACDAIGPPRPPGQVLGWRTSASGLLRQPLPWDASASSARAAQHSPLTEDAQRALG